MPLQVTGGTRSFKHDLKRQAPSRAGQTSRSASALGVLACIAKCRQGNLRAGPPSLRPRPFAAGL
eukprot:310420-Pyramimonas_sp.AAC.1